MTLPTALQKAEAEADALILGNRNNPEQGNPESSNAPEPKQGTPVNQDPKSEDWEQKYKVLQGMFNSQVNSLQEKVRKLESQSDSSQAVEQLQAQIQTLQHDNSQLKQALQEQESSKPAQLNPYLVDEYGNDFAQAVAEQAEILVNDRISKVTSEYDAKIAELTNQNQSTAQNLQQVSSDTRLQTLKGILKQQNVEWDITNDDPAFHAWLSEIDQYSGAQRQQLLEHAFNSGDMQRTARFYTDFVASQSNAPNNPLRQHVDPTTGFTPTETATQTAAFDEAELKRINRLYREGRMTTEEFERRENEIYASLSRPY